MVFTTDALRGPNGQNALVELRTAIAIARDARHIPLPLVVWLYKGDCASFEVIHELRSDAGL
jgi:hypothetical protein